MSPSRKRSSCCRVKLRKTQQGYGSESISRSLSKRATRESVHPVSVCVRGPSLLVLLVSGHTPPMAWRCSPTICLTCWVRFRGRDRTTGREWPTLGSAMVAPHLALDQAYGTSRGHVMMVLWCTPLLRYGFEPLARRVPYRFFEKIVDMLF